MVRVRVPASSANLGPGFDCFAAALDLHLELEVSPADSFEVVCDPSLPRDRSNLVVRAFERIHPADGLRFRIGSAIPRTGGLGSSAAAIVAGLLAARELAESHPDLFALASELEGHPDNVAAALHGGFVICGDGEIARIDPPPGLAAVVAVGRERLATAHARAALPDALPFADGVFNVARASLLTLGLERGDHGLIARGLADRMHQPRRAHLYPRSLELVERAVALGALGATISGAGPSVLFWTEPARESELRGRLADELGDWGEAHAIAFEPRGAELGTDR